MKGSAGPAVVVSNRQRMVAVNVSEIEKLARAAIPACLKQKGNGQAVLASLAEVEVAIVSDRVIARVHRRFLNVPGATDVITFGHGELIVSATTAARRAGELGESAGRELLRYIVHGVLHLNGHEDADPVDAAGMWRVQEEILDAVWPLG